MLCTKCKKPIEDNSTICEWCGAICTHQNVDQLGKDKRSTDLDTQLLNVLSGKPTPLQLQQSVKLYSGSTGYNMTESQDYISKLWCENFPVEYAERCKKIKKQIKIDTVHNFV